jgi:cyclohexanecarboxyl-CoA dehydrogenase
VFEFSESHKMVREQARSFARKELAAGASERAKQIIIAPEIWKKVADMGYTGLGVPEKYGGQEVDWITIGIVIEELSKVDFNVGALTQHIQNMAFGVSQGAEEVAAEWVPALVDTTKVCSAAISEPGCGSDIGAIQTRAVKDGDNYVITGEKTSVTRGTYADICSVVVKTDPAAGMKGLRSFLVPFDLPGITRAPLNDMGCKPMGRAMVNFDEVVVPAKYMTTREGSGFSPRFATHVNQGRAIAGLFCLAAAQASLDEAVAYSKERKAFGYPIAKYEGVSFKLAEAATFIEAARWLCYYTLWLGDQGQPSFKEGCMCKWWCPQLAVEIIHNCLLVYGHVGYTEELPIEQRLRDVIGFEFADGTAEINKLNICRELIGREAIPYR